MRPTLPLTPFQLRLASLVAEDHTTRELAMMLKKDIRTIRRNRSRLVEKLGCRTYVGIALWYKEQNGHTTV